MKAIEGESHHLGEKSPERELARGRSSTDLRLHSTPLLALHSALLVPHSPRSAFDTPPLSPYTSHIMLTSDREEDRGEERSVAEQIED